VRGPYIRVERTQSRPPKTEGINIGMMPLRKNVPAPGSSDWELTTCPRCGRECWYQAENAELIRTIWPNTKFLCTECALTAGMVVDIG